MDAVEIVKKLADFKERACSGENQEGVLSYLESLFQEQKTERQAFKTPANYLVTVAWLILGISIGLLVTLKVGLLGFLITVFFGVWALLYFNWYASPVSRFPPLRKSTNLIVRNVSKAISTTKIILMAHWDTAPISVLYAPKMVGNFRSSLIINMILIILAIILTFLKIFLPENYFLSGGIITLSIYFLIQMVVASFDFFRYGYSNGASDNATGVAAAITSAHELWKNKEIETALVLTGAEEVGMIGAKAYYDTYKNTFDENTFLINFDTLGSGELKIISKTGSMGDIVYSNILTEKLTSATKIYPEFSHIKSGAWHTADFDSVWFQRGGVKAVTLAALDSNGRMHNIHRETDVIENVDFKPMLDAIDLVVKVFGKF